RTPAELDGLDALILPGGESGAHIRILKENGLWESLRAFHARGGALWGTCAGLILLAHDVSGPVQESLDLIDIDVVRNGWGRQLDSFETDVPRAAWAKGTDAMPARAVPAGIPRANSPAEAPESLRLVFIRAPRISRVGPEVLPLLRLGGEVIAARQGRVMVTAFHPEMTIEPTIHRWFLEQVVGNVAGSVSSNLRTSPIAR
ncbi:MAG: glutamine amidotransferase, partial [bacterium]